MIIRTCVDKEFALIPGGGGSSYMLVYTDVPLEWGTFLTMGCYFHNLLYQWVGMRAISSMSGKFIPGIYHSNYTVSKYMIGSGFSSEIYMNGYGFQKY
jgi:hypothetical protein